MVVGFDGIILTLDLWAGELLESIPRQLENHHQGVGGILSSTGATIWSGGGHDVMMGGGMRRDCARVPDMVEGNNSGDGSVGNSP